MAGGAWKVAYADFVTAMMALFMVLWIIGQDTEILESTSRYFQNPFNSPLERSSGMMGEGDESIAEHVMSQEIRSSMMDMSLLHDMAQEFYRLLDLESSDAEVPVEVVVTDDGLRVVIYDKEEQPFFVKKSVDFTDWGDLIIKNLAWLVESYRLNVRIDAFCPEGLNWEDNDYGAFDLTADRANAARRALVYYALDATKIERVTGHGDRKPLPDIDPEDPKNQRLEISLRLF